MEKKRHYRHNGGNAIDRPHEDVLRLRTENPSGEETFSKAAVDSQAGYDAKTCFATRKDGRFELAVYKRKFG